MIVTNTLKLGEIILKMPPLCMLTWKLVDKIFCQLLWHLRFFGQMYKKLVVLTNILRNNVCVESISH